MQAQTRNTIIAGFFTVAVFSVGLIGFSDAIFYSVDTIADKSKTSPQAAVENITQKVSASSHCSNTYGQDLDGDGVCERSASTTYTVVLQSTTTTSTTTTPTTTPTTTVNAIDDPSPTSDYQVVQGSSFLADGSSGNPDGVLANDQPSPGKTNLTVSNWDTSGMDGSMLSTAINGEFEYDAPDTISGTTTTSFNYTATNGSSSDSATGTVQITPASCASGPVAQDDSYTVAKGGELDTDADGLASTYSDDSNVPSNVTITDTPQFGSLTFDDSTGHFVYDHTAGNTNQDSFKYELSDGTCTDTATVTVNPQDKPPVAVITGPDAINFCEADVSELTFDGGSSYDQDQGGAAINGYSWSVTGPTSSSLTKLNTQTTRFDKPIDWSGTSTLSLEVTDNENSTDSTSTLVTVNEPGYDADIIVPKDTPKRLWMTASSTNRSTKATVKVSGIGSNNPPYDLNYDFSDLDLRFPDKSGVPSGAIQSTSSASAQEFTFWIDPQDESQELPFGTYKLTGAVVLEPTPACVYDDETFEIDLRVQTTAEF
jgi:hypothetical protein